MAINDRLKIFLILAFPAQFTASKSIESICQRGLSSNLVSYQNCTEITHLNWKNLIEATGKDNLAVFGVKDIPDHSLVKLLKTSDLDGYIFEEYVGVSSTPINETAETIVTPDVYLKIQGVLSKYIGGNSDALYHLIIVNNRRYLIGRYMFNKPPAIYCEALEDRL